MIEGIIRILGMCLTFIPIIIYVHYLWTSVREKRPFNYHVDNVRDKKGNFGVFIAYLDKMLFGVSIISLGVFVSSYFTNNLFLEIFIVVFIFYVIVRYIDNKNEG